MSSRQPRRLLLGAVLVACLVVSTVGCGQTATDPLSHWRQALKDRQQHAATWLAIGDSITEGQGASARQDRWIDRTAASLRDGVPGGAGYVPGWYAVYGPDSTWTAYAARTGTVTDESASSLGLRTAVLPAGASQTYAFTGTSADLYYTAGGGVLGYSVDGGPATDIDTAGPVAAKRSHVDSPAPGDHSLTVTALSGTVRLAGAAGFDGDEDSGVHLVDSAHSGYTSGQFVAADADQDPLVSLVQPDLVTIELGVNDYLKGDATPEHVSQNLEDLVQDVRKQVTTPPSIVLVIPYGIGPASGGAARTWDEYADAIRTLGPALSVGVLDLSSMGTASPGGTWSSDGLHQSDAGHAEMARLAATYLSADR